MLRYNFSARCGVLVPLFFLLFFMGTPHLWGQESVELITVKDITPKKSLRERLDGDFVIAPYYAGGTGGGFVMAYNVGQSFSLVGNVMQGESLSLVMFKARYMYGVSERLSIGPMLGYNRLKWEGEQAVTAYSVGGAVQFDNRNSVAAPSSGVYASLRQSCYSDFSSSAYCGTAMQFDAYTPLWNRAVLAFDLYGEFMYGNVPWSMLSTVGDSQRMRGYRMWDYVGNNAVSAQVELRQNVWSFLGVAMWGGGAILWGDDNNPDSHIFLPNAGVGIRCRILDNLALRLDWGIGKNGQNGFVFGINEAF